MLRITLSSVCCPRSIISMCLLFPIWTLSISLFLLFHLTFASPSATALINSHCFINPSHQICISLYLFHSICSTSTLWWLAGQIYHQGCIQNPSPFLLRQHYAIDILCHSIRFYLLGDTRIQLAHLLQSGYWLGTETYNIPYHPTRRVFLDVC